MERWPAGYTHREHVNLGQPTSAGSRSPNHPDSCSDRPVVLCSGMGDGTLWSSRRILALTTSNKCRHSAVADMIANQGRSSPVCLDSDMAALCQRSLRRGQDGLGSTCPAPSPRSNTSWSPRHVMARPARQQRRSSMKPGFHEQMKSGARSHAIRRRRTIFSEPWQSLEPCPGNRLNARAHSCVVAEWNVGRYPGASCWRDANLLAN